MYLRMPITGYHFKDQIYALIRKLKISERIYHLIDRSLLSYKGWPHNDVSHFEVNNFVSSKHRYRKVVCVVR